MLDHPHCHSTALVFSLCTRRDIDSDDSYARPLTHACAQPFVWFERERKLRAGHRAETRQTFLLFFFFSFSLFSFCFFHHFLFSSFFFSFFFFLFFFFQFSVFFFLFSFFFFFFLFLIRFPVRKSTSPVLASFPVLCICCFQLLFVRVSYTVDSARTIHACLVHSCTQTFHSAIVRKKDYRIMVAEQC